MLTLRPGQIWQCCVQRYWIKVLTFTPYDVFGVAKTEVTIFYCDTGVPLHPNVQVRIQQGTPLHFVGISSELQPKTLLYSLED
jgi:hypothetical protein